MYSAPLVYYRRLIYRSTSLRCDSLHSRITHLSSAFDELLVPRRCVVEPLAAPAHRLATRPRRYPLHSNTPESPAMSAW